VDKLAVDNGFVTIRGLVGHGVGYAVHEAPQIPNFGFRGQGMELEEGMVLAFEPMLAERSRDIVQSGNNITYLTEKGDLAAHFEHTVAITENGYEILTLPKQ
jgi:methionyl aminopeptidase